ncbi:MAG TPA: hypothetical protein VJT83_00605 [Chitinophagaceae bacterium]|nr:hypothetical protein [Chitinophagaceae bacterium]
MQPAKFFGHFVSIVLHPLFISSLVAGFLIYIHPTAFPGMTDKMKFFRFVSVFVSTTLLPAFSVFLMWRLQLVINSLQMKTQKERIIPYAIAMIFYFWVWYVFKNLDDSPVEIRQFLLGAFLAVCGGWFANIFFKISMHTLAMGGVLMFFLIIAIRQPELAAYLAIVILLTGLVTTSRLLVSNHSNSEVYSGLAVGAASQLIAILFV